MEADKILYKLFLEGDNKAFEKIVLKYKDNLIYFLQRYIKDFFTCEDIAQDVFAYIFAFKEKYNQEYSLKTYIFTIARNKAVDYIRKQGKLVSLSNALDGKLNEDSEQLINKIVQDEDIKLVHMCLNQLNCDYQKAVILVDFEELSYKDASHIMGKTIPQFKILLHRARKSLKLLLKKGGYAH